MKIAFFHNLPVGGALRVFDEQVKYFSKKYEVEIFNVNLDLKGARLFRDFDNFFTLNKLHKKLAKAIDAKNFDLVVVHHCKLTQAPFILRHLKTPSLYYVEENLRIVYEDIFKYDDKSNLIKYFYENLSRNIRKLIDYKNATSATVIVANSKFTSYNVFRAYNRKSRYIHPAVDLNVFKPYKSNKHNQLVFVGAKDNINGYPLAQKISKKSKLKLLVVNGNKLTDIELAKEYSKSIATLALSYNEPFGLVPIESFACNTPVLAVNEGGYKETVKDSVNGFLLNRDASSFVDKLNLIKSGYKFKFDKHGLSWETHNKKLEKMLISLANGKN